MGVGYKGGRGWSSYSDLNMEEMGKLMKEVGGVLWCRDRERKERNGARSAPNERNSSGSSGQTRIVITFPSNDMVVEKCVLTRLTGHRASAWQDVRTWRRAGAVGLSCLRRSHQDQSVSPHKAIRTKTGRTVLLRLLCCASHLYRDGRSVQTV